MPGLRDITEKELKEHPELEAASKYATTKTFGPGRSREAVTQRIANHFLAGAQWAYEQSVSCDHPEEVGPHLKETAKALGEYAKKEYERGRMSMRKEIWDLLHSDAAHDRDYGDDGGPSAVGWAEWLESKLAELDARPGETSGEGKE